MEDGRKVGLSEKVTQTLRSSSKRVEIHTDALTTKPGSSIEPKLVKRIESVKWDL